MSTEETGVRRHPPQLLRQMEQEDQLSANLGGLKRMESVPQQQQHYLLSSKTTPAHRAPVTQDSQGSSSTGSGATGMSVGTSGGSLSSRSTRLGQTSSGTGRGTRCSSSTSSSTEETEARERRFGSLDLHPLPTVAPPAVMTSTVRRGLIGPSGPRSHLHYNVLLTMHQRFTSQSEGPSDSLERQNCQPSIPTANNSVAFSDPTNEPTALSTASLVNKLEAGLNLTTGQVASSNENMTHLFGLLPPALWPCLLCPLHGASLAKSSGLLLADGEQDPVLATPNDDPSHPGRPLQSTPDPTTPSKSSLSSSTPKPDSTTTNTVSTAREDSISLAGSSTTVKSVDKCPDSSTAVVPTAPHIGPYQLGPTLGRGNFAVVKLAKHVPTKIKVAIKIMNKELIGSNNLNKITRELEAMKRCQHPHIIRLYHVMETESSIFMVTEYASKGEVFDHISISRAFSEKEARELFWQVVCAIDFCHHSGVVHRDLKAENLLLDSEFKIKVADFGFCNFFQPDEFLSTHCGSPQYAAPELFKGEPYDGPLVDVWSLGVILYIFVCGSFPFPGESLGDIRSQVLRGLVRFPFFLSTSCEQVIRCMLQVDPARRFKLHQVIATQWMQDSPNVEHYRAMMSRYESKAKERHFDELFRSQYPEHSELARVHQAERAQRQLDGGILRALAVGAGFDEEQIRFSTLQNKCDRWHAAYELLRAKIRRFQRNPNLSNYVDEAMRSSSGAVSHMTRSVRRRSSLLNTWLSSASQQSSSGSPAVGLDLVATPGSDVTGDQMTGSTGDVDGTFLRRGPQLPTVPDVVDETMAEAEAERVSETNAEWKSPEQMLGLQVTSKSPSNAESDRKQICWKDPKQPTSTDFNVALFILKADEDLIMSQLGLTPCTSINPTMIPSIRRHTVQFTGSPLTFIRPPPPTETSRASAVTETELPSESVPAESESVTSETEDGTVPIDEVGSIADSDLKAADLPSKSSQRTTTNRFSRQTTQPHTGTFQQFKSKAFQPEQLIRTALDWFPSPWGSGFRMKNSAMPESHISGSQSEKDQATAGSKNTSASSKVAAMNLTQQTLPSLELGEEASTSKPPPPPAARWRGVRPGLQRRDSVHQDYEDDVDANTTADVAQSSTLARDPSGDDSRPIQPRDMRLLNVNKLDNTSAFVINAGSMGYDIETTQDGFVKAPPGGSSVRENTELSKCMSLQTESDEQGTTTAPVAMDTDVPEDATVYPEPTVFPCWPATPIENGDTRCPEGDDVCDPSTHLSTLLPQLNLPANLPAMIHQPVARFTVKDPHLLAPPDFMTPHCSSFPRRSSDGAAELQPLHRPALAVGGSYPEQTNYRNMHSSTEDTTGALGAVPSPGSCTHDATPYLAQAHPDSSPADASVSHASRPCEACVTAAKDLNVGATTTGVNDTADNVSSQAATGKPITASSRSRVSRRALHPMGFRLRTAPMLMTSTNRTPNLLATQQRSILSYMQPTLIDRIQCQSLGRRQQQSTEQGVEESRPGEQPSTAVIAQLARHRKRFSLPASYRPVRQMTLPNKSGSGQNGTCLCNHPLTPELVQHIQHMVHGHLIPPALHSTHPSTMCQDTLCKPLEATVFRRGSEASQLLAWKQRLSQYGGMVEPIVPEPAFGPTIVASTLKRDGAVTDLSHTPCVTSSHASYTSSLSTSPLGGAVRPSACASPLRRSPGLDDGHTRVHSHAAPDLTDALAVPPGLSPTSPPGIELDDLKTELHKLETENRSESQTYRSSADDETNKRLTPPPPPSPSLVSGSRAGDARRHYMHAGRRPQRSSESPTSIPPTTTGASVTSTPKASLTTEPDAPRHWMLHRVSSLKVPRRAASAVAGSVGRGRSFRQSPNDNPTTELVEAGLDSTLPRRYRYSVGDHLDHTVNTLQDDLSFSSVAPSEPPPFAPLSCQPSVLGLHSHPNGQHQASAATLSNPDHPSSFGHRLGGSRVPSFSSSGMFIPTSVAAADDHDRTALSSPGPVPMLDLPLTWPNAQCHNPEGFESAGPVCAVAGFSSAGVKRRLLASVHQKSNDYLRTLQRAGGSLDRRLNFDLLNSPKRKVYQEWLPKVAAFSRKAATTMLKAVHPTAQYSQQSPSVFNLSPSATSSVCEDPSYQSHSARASASPTGVPPSLRFTATHMSTSARSSTASLTHTMDQESDENGARCTTAAVVDTGHIQLDDDDNDDDKCLVLSEDEDEDEDDNAEEEEEEKQCALAPLQSHLAMNMAYTHSSRNRYNLTPMAPSPGLTLPPCYLVDPQQASAAQQQFTMLGRVPNLPLVSAASTPFQTNTQLTTGFFGPGVLQGHGGTASANAATLLNTPLYGIPNDSQTMTAAAAASLMLLRPGDDDDDLAEIDRVNQRLAMGELSDFLPSSYVSQDTSSLRNFGAPTQSGPTQSFPDSQGFLGR